jgi:hypothetical protein
MNYLGNLQTFYWLDLVDIAIEEEEGALVCAYCYLHYILYKPIL